MITDIFNLSDEQEKAVDITKNIAVSAGAGSGKTRVLTNRYLRLLEAGTDVEEIGAITFTDKAALEMKKRVRLAINEKINMCSGNDKIKWMGYLDKLNNANISTIHSFCSNIVKENAAILGIDFNYNIITDIDKDLILKDVVQKSLRNSFMCEEYKESLGKLISNFDDKYFSKDFNKEIKNIMVQTLQQDEILEELSAKYEKGSAEKLIIRIIKKTSESYGEYKSKHDLLDYDDLQNLALKLLENKEINNRYRKRFKNLLVDEFQDTDELQKRIIYKIAADDDGRLIDEKLFIVGDFKQSIYGFKGADYTIFKTVSEDIGDTGRVSLNTCYRSKNEIIHAINSIFKELIEEYESLRYQNNQELKEKRVSIITYKNKAAQKKVSISGEVKKLLRGKKSSIETLEEGFQVLTESNNSIDIKESNSGIAVTKAIKLLKDKGLKFKDMSILVRAKTSIPTIENELRKRRVPYCIIGGRGFYETDEVEDVLNLYKVVIRGFEGEFSVQDSKNFIKALRSPLFEIPDTIILKAKIEMDENNCINLYKALEFVIDGMKECEDKFKLKKIYSSLEKLYLAKERLSVVYIMKYILEEFDVYNLILAQERGLQKYRNIEKLLYEAEKFDNEQLFTLEKFADYIELLEENSMQDAEAPLDTEDSEAVKIMTIHQAKGLEFKGVIIPNLEKDLLYMAKNHKPKITHFEGEILFSRNLETGNDNYNDKDSNYFKYYNSKLEKEVHEYIRLLYVAMTRAVDYIVLTGEDDGKSPSKAEEDAKKFNTFMKQIKYALYVKGADQSFIEILDYDKLEDLETVNQELKNTYINEQSIRDKIQFKLDIKPSTTVSATKYIHYKKSPNEFYLGNLLGVNLKDYIGMEFEEKEETTLKEQSIYKEGESNAADLGIVVHHILEIINSDMNVDEEKLIKSAISKYRLDNIDEIEKRVKKLIDNYKALENQRENMGKLICKYNEIEYNLQPLEDRKTSFIGFIDRLEVYEGDNGLTAVITDYKTNRISGQEHINRLAKVYEPQLYLYGKAIKELFYNKGVNGDTILLQLYFLDVGKKTLMNYDDKEAEKYIDDMDKIFAKPII